MSENIARWLRLSPTRRMFARALGGGEHPNDTYLRMAAEMLDVVAKEWARVPWAEPDEREAVEQALSVERPHHGRGAHAGARAVSPDMRGAGGEMKLAALLAALLALVVLWPRPAAATWTHWRPVPEAAFTEWNAGPAVSAPPVLSPKASSRLGLADDQVFGGHSTDASRSHRLLQQSIAPSPAPTIVPTPRTGVASWYDDGPGMYAALPGFVASTHEWASVCAFGGERTTCITVPVVTSCQCYVGTPHARLIDLSPDAFARLAPLSQGLVRVTVEIVR